MSDLFGPGRATPVTDLAEAVRSADGVVNASPVGMFGYPGTPVAGDLLRPQMWVAEVIYFPLETELLQAARRVGCATLGGGGMAVFQAAEAFELFTNHRPDVERMLRSFDASSPKETGVET
jgi:shikimate dehydrogenase